MALSRRCLSALTVLALALPLAAEEPPAPGGGEVFGESIDVRVVNVEAVVAGRDGRPLRGLAREDFRLLVDGREVPVEYFAEVADGAAVTASGLPVAAGEEVGKSYLVFVDDSLALGQQRDDLLRRLESSLSLLRPVDRMAVLAFDGLHLDVLSPWTGDTAALAAALERARLRPTHGAVAKVHQYGPERDVTFILESAGILDDGDSSGPSAVGVELAELGQRPGDPDALTDAHKSAEAVAAALRGFEAPPGRKVLLLVSGAWTLQQGPRLYAPVMASANRLGYTVYPVDAAQSGTDAILVSDELARTTGGRAVAAFDNDVLRQVAADTGTYYWLGFSPDWKADDRGHRVTVEVRRPNVYVRSRRGFSDLSKRTENALRAEGVLLFGGAKEDRRLVVQLGQPRRRGRDLEVPVTLGVPVEALSLAAEGSGYRAEVPLAVAALDEKGGRADLPGSRLKVAVAEPPRPGTYARFQTVVRLRNLGQRLVFSVPDPVGGGSLWAEANVGSQGRQRR